MDCHITTPLPASYGESSSGESPQWTSICIWIAIDRQHGVVFSSPGLRGDVGFVGVDTMVTQSSLGLFKYFRVSVRLVLAWWVGM